MAQSKTTTQGPASSRRDQSWLLPPNRKLRNLVSISVRNLTLSSPNTPLRSRGKTIDDDALPQTHQSPAKAHALREQRALGTSRSSTDLRTWAEEAVADEKEEVVDHGVMNGSPRSGKQKERALRTAQPSPRRPEFKRRRRRSTLEWANSTPHHRQLRLEDMMQERLVDTFFSLHVQGVEDAVYVSEIVHQTINPTFQHVDWSACGPEVTRIEEFTLRLWTRSGKEPKWRRFLQMNVAPRGLQYLGKTLDGLSRSLPTNAVLFYLVDGVYMAAATVADMMLSHQDHIVRPPSRTSAKTLPTSSFDALLRLSKLDDSIQDALATRNKIAGDLERIFKENEHALRERDQVDQAADRLKTIKFAQATVQKQLEKARKQQQEKRSLLQSRRQMMRSDLELRAGQVAEMATVLPDIPNSRSEVEVRKRAIQNQRRRVCEELQLCYPILPSPGKTLAFTVRDLHLPNAEDLDSEPPDRACAALGYVALILQMLSFYLDTPVPYPVSFRGSASTIFDPISLLKASTSSGTSTPAAEQKLRTYPLFSKGVPRFRFEYAVFLLNQDIRMLLDNAFSVRVLDIRQTLPNLKYLLYVATAGEGELPARKAGGVKGLLRGGAAVRRIGSSDSTSSVLSGLTLGAGIAHVNGKAKGAVARLREISGNG